MYCQYTIEEEQKVSYLLCQYQDCYKATVMNTIVSHCKDRYTDQGTRVVISNTNLHMNGCPHSPAPFFLKRCGIIQGVETTWF